MTERVTIEREIAVPMQDGVTLATDVYAPAEGGPFPTLVYRVRGGRSAAFIVGMLLLNPLDAVKRGYAVVVQEVRGRAGSGDAWHPFVHERSDGADCLDWVLVQPFCDGRIGTYGTAYSAVAGLQMAAARPDAVHAAVVLGTGADYHDGWVYTSGAFELGWNVYWAYMTLAETIGRLDVDDDTRAELQARYADAVVHAGGVATRLPLRDHPLLLECGERQFHEWLDHPDYDDYWAGFDLLAVADQLSVPMLSIVGWWDNFLSSHLDLYRALAPRAPHRLVIGPWEHANYVSPFSTSRTGDVEFGPPASCGVGVSAPMALDWFDRHVKGEDRGPSGGVRYWLLGVDEWREAESWPLPTVEQRWYLHSGGQANTRDGDGVLSADPPSSAEPADSYLYDPADPVPTVGGKTLMPTIMTAGIKDQSRVEDREDVLCYTSPALATPLEVAGPVRVELWAASSAPDTDFTVKLVDVSPEGYAANLADGIVRARYRESRKTRSAPLAAGQPTSFTIDLWDLAHTFLVGHRIRVEISSSNFPRFDRNLNTPPSEAPFGSESLADARTAAQVVLHDPDHPSYLILPTAQ